MWELRVRSIVAAVVVLGVVGCGNGDGEGPGEGRSPIVLDVPITIGAGAEGRAEYLFGSIAGVGGDEAGQIYVVDRIAANVRVYDSVGVHIATVGREGDGPGEFRTPSGLLVSHGPELWIHDRTRIQAFRPSGSGAVPDSVVTVWTLASYASLLPRRAAVTDSAFLYPRYFYPLDGPPEYFYEVISNGVVRDTLRIPALVDVPRLRGASYRGGRLERRERAVIESLSLAPFEAVPVWDVGPEGTVWVGHGDSAVIREYGAGGQVLTEVRIPWVREAPSQLAVSDSAEALRARLVGLSVPLDRIDNVSSAIVHGTSSDSLPYLTAMYVPDTGEIWARLWPTGPETTDFAVFRSRR